MLVLGFLYLRASLVVQRLKCLAAVWETWVGEDPLEEGMATHSSILAWRMPWTEQPGRLQSLGLQRVKHDSVIEQQHSLFWASQVAQRVKNMPAGQETQETQVRSLGRKDSLEEYMATHSSILAWRMPWTEEPGGLQFTGLQRVGHN